MPMPLMDHWRAGADGDFEWEAIHNAWATFLMNELNLHLLPEGYRAYSTIRLTTRVEVDVATLERRRVGGHVGNGSAAAVMTWSPPAVEMVMPAVFPDSIEVLVRSLRGGPTLAAAIELVSTPEMECQSSPFLSNFTR